MPVNAQTTGSSQSGEVGRGEFRFTALFLVATIVLAAQLTAQTKFSSSGHLVAQPRFWPALALCGMACFGAVRLAMLLRERRREHGLSRRLLGVRDVAGEGVHLLEYTLWFMGYVYLVPVAGYLGTSIAFMILVAARAGYRRLSVLACAAATGVCIVVLFKTVLGVNIPGGAVYELLPAAPRALMIANF